MHLSLPQQRQQQLPMPLPPPFPLPLPQQRQQQRRQQQQRPQYEHQHQRHQHPQKQHPQKVHDRPHHQRHKRSHHPNQLDLHPQQKQQHHSHENHQKKRPAGCIGKDDSPHRTIDKGKNIIVHEDVFCESFDAAANFNARQVEEEDEEKDFTLIAPNVYRRYLRHHHCQDSTSSSTLSTPSSSSSSIVADGGGPTTVGQEHEAYGRSSRRLLFTRKVWDGDNGRWKPMEHFYYVEPHNDQDETDPSGSVQYKVILSRGGEIRIFPNLVYETRTDAMKQELLDPKYCHYFRKYCIQGGDEPRVHFLLHRDATSDFSRSQPGYEYARIKMKARPLSTCPHLEKLSMDIGRLRNVQHWDIGIHTVLYRDMNDAMGDHADDDQGETKIFCVLVETPPTPRVVRVNVFRKLTQSSIHRDSNGRRLHIRQDGDEIIELYLERGDAYEMDGIMQHSYSHGVPRSPVSANKHNHVKVETPPTNSTGSTKQDNTGDCTVHPADGNDSPATIVNNYDNKFQRICVVLRTGIQKYIDKDSGQPCTDLRPKKPVSYFIGTNHQVEEGTFWTRRQLKDIGVFQVRKPLY